MEFWKLWSINTHLPTDWLTHSCETSIIYHSFIHCFLPPRVTSLSHFPLSQWESPVYAYTPPLNSQRYVLPLRKKSAFPNTTHTHNATLSHQCDTHNSQITSFFCFFFRDCTTNIHTSDTASIINSCYSYTLSLSYITEPRAGRRSMDLPSVPAIRVPTFQGFHHYHYHNDEYNHRCNHHHHHDTQLSSLKSPVCHSFGWRTPLGTTDSPYRPLLPHYSRANYINSPSAPTNST